MAHSSTPHFHNTEGLARIEVGSKEFQCIGALPPFDHPHIFLDMGKDNEIVCSY
ncbi:MAG: zinc-finger domain-containing protein, partial [Devosia sp.]